MTSRTLRTSIDDRVVCGVSGGLAEYFDVDVSIVRVGWIVVTCVTFGLAALAYGCLAVVMSRPGGLLDARTEANRDPEGRPVSGTDTKAPPVDLKDEARLLMEVRQELGAEYDEALVESFVDKVEQSLGRGGDRTREDQRPTDSARSRRVYIALGLVIAGASVLVINEGLFPWLRWEVAIALAAIGAGALLCFRRP